MHCLVKSSFGVFASIAMAGVSSTQAANLLVNGSFELASPAANAAIIANGLSSTQNGDITGWTTSIGSSGAGYWYFATGGYGDAQDQSRFLNLTSPPYNIGPISQSFAVVAGTTYEVSFWEAERGDYAGINPTPAVDNLSSAITFASGSATGTTSIVASNPNSISFGASPATGWQLFSYQFTPNSTGNATLTFNSGAESGFAVLDNVAVNAVPEPAALSFMAMGTLLMGRRRVHHR